MADNRILKLVDSSYKECEVTGRDMGGDDICFQLLCKLQNALGFFNRAGILFGVAKAHAKVTANRREAQAVGLDHVKQLASLRCTHIFRCVFAVGAVHLQALHAHFRSSFDSGMRIGTEGFNDYADGKLFHRIYLQGFRYSCIIYFLS